MTMHPAPNAPAAHNRLWGGAAARFPARFPARSPARLRACALAAAACAGIGFSIGISQQAQAATFNWSSGNFAPGVTAPSPLPAADVLNVLGNSLVFDGVSFSSGGTVNWLASNSLLQLFNGVQLTNAGLWDAQGDAMMSYSQGSASSFTNTSTGTLRKSGGLGTTTIGTGLGVQFTNSGAIDAQTGTIVLAGVNTFHAGSSFTGAGRVMVTAASTFNGAFQSSNLRLSGGVQTGNAAVLNGNASMTGGALAGSWTVNTGASLNLLGGATKELPGTLENRGAVVWQAAGGQVASPLGSFVNRGSFEARGDGTWSAGVGSSGSLGALVSNEATGTFSKTGGSGTTRFGQAALLFTNRGAIAAQTGTLQFSGTNTFHAGTSFSGAGTVLVDGLSTFLGSFQSANLTLGGGVQTGSNAVLNGTARWTEGTVIGSWSTASGATLTLAGGGTRSLGQASVVNNGTWLLLDDTSMDNQGSSTFQNAGTLRKGSGAGVATLGQSANGNFAFSNTGTIEAQAGTLRLTGANSFGNGSVFTGAGRVEVASSSSFSGTQQTSNLHVTGGAHQGANAVVQGQMGWTAGTLHSQWTVASGSTLTLQGAASKSLGANFGMVVVNNGQVVMDAQVGGLALGPGQVTNNGTWLIQGDGGLVWGGAGASTFNNTGTLRKTGGSSTTVLSSNVQQAFINTGVVDVRSGTIALPANFNNTGTLMGDGRFSTAGQLRNSGTVAPGSQGIGHLQLAGDYQQAAGGVLTLDLSTLASFDRLSITGAASLDGTLALSCLSACFFAVGDTFTILSSTGARNGSFAGGVLLNGFAPGTFELLYGSNDVRLRVALAVTSVPEPGTWALMAAGLLLLGQASRRRRPKPAQA